MITPKEFCTGCGACYISCPVKAIKMIRNYEGFFYPVIDQKVCIKCGKCKKICPISEHIKTDRLDHSYIIGCWSKNEIVRNNSSSGGIFSELAELIIKNGGIAVGAAYSRDFYVCHKVVKELKGISTLRTSKYIQSDNPYRSFPYIKEKLIENKIVLFSGTSCQVDGLYKYLGQDYPKLITCDLICHGVGSPIVFRRYLEMLEKIYHSDVSGVNMRDKSSGWHNYSIKITFRNKRIYKSSMKKDLFMRGYSSNLYLRTSCHNCKYRKFPRTADLTLGDFWRIEKWRPNLYNDLGISLVMINSNKGIDLFEKLKKTEIIEYWPYKDKDITLLNSALIKSPTPNKYRSEFFDELTHNNTAGHTFKTFLKFIKLKNY